MPRKVLIIILGTLAFLAIGVASMRFFVSLRTPPQRQVSATLGPLVRVHTVTLQDVPLRLHGFGTVRPKTVWSMVPEVSGVAVQLSPQLRAGLHVKQGELLLEIDPRAYRLAVQRINAQITQLQKEMTLLTQQRQNHHATLRIAEKNLAIAEEDVQRDETLVHKGTISPRDLDRRRQWRNEYLHAVQTTTNSLALIGPQIEQTEASIAVARAQLADAELQLHKTRLYAPFDGQVVTSTLDLGEFVQAGREVATLYDTSAVEIPLTMPLDDLRWLSSLSPETLRQAYRAPASVEPLLPAATVYWQRDHGGASWQGRVLRWEAGLDEKTRTMTLVVEVRDPWKTFRPGAQPPLQPGMFCEVEITAQTVPQAALLPRTALRDHHTVFLVQDGVLAVRQVQVLRLLRDQVIITGGLQPGDRVIVSPLGTPVIGMQLRPVEDEPSSPHPALPVSRSDSTAALTGKPTPPQREP